jgi:hypothetical protein
MTEKGRTVGAGAMETLRWSTADFIQRVTTIPSSGLQILGRGVLLLVGLFLLVATIPFGAYPINVGLDAGWPYALSALANSSYIVGRDWAYTYGPLGYLFVPVDIGRALTLGLAFSILVHIALAVVLLYLLWRTQTWFQGVIFLAGYALANAVPHAIELEMLLLAVLLLILVLRETKWALPAALVLGPFLAVLSYTKTSLGLTALLVVAIAMTLTVLRRRPIDRPSMLAIGVTAASFLVTWGIIAFMVFRSIGALTAWFLASGELVRGYTIAMSMIGPSDALVWGIGLVGVMGLTALEFWVTNDPSAGIAIALAVGSWLLFKEGFVREDSGHMLLFFPVVICLAAVLVLVARHPGAKPISAVCLWCCATALISMAAVGNLGPDATLPNAVHLLSTNAGRDNLSLLLTPGETRARLRAASTQALQADRLPPDWLAAIAAANGTVDVIPSELSFIPSNDLRWVPNPTLQLYANYTAWLDERTAAHFLDSDAPTFLLAQFADIDGRNPMLSAPATWRAVMGAYEPVKSDQNRNLFLLRRKANIETAPFQSATDVRARIGQDIIVPETGESLYARIDMHLSALGRLESAIFRIAPVSLELTYASGKTVSRRVMPDTLTDAAFINYLPDNSQDFAQLLDGRASDRVTTFRVVGPGTSSYTSKISVRWVTLPVQVAYSPLAPPTTTLPAVVTKDNGGTNYSIDLVNGRAAPQSGSTLKVDTNTGVIISGWAVDDRSERPASAVFLDIDGQKDFRATSGLLRADVAAYFKHDEFAASGFEGVIPWRQLGEGLHTLSLRIVSSDGKSYYQPDYHLTLDNRS